jgi:murein tripeptide amidase MpaA
LAAGALLVSLLATAADAQQPSPDPASQPEQGLDYQQYTVVGPQTREQRTEVARTGAAIDEENETGLVVTATKREARAIARLGYQVEPFSPVTTEVLPPGFAGYHDFAEMNAVVNQVVADHPAIAQKRVIGQSFQGRDIVAVRISDNVATEEGEPEVLFTHSQHAREILTVEMAIHLMNLFTDNYGSDAHITQLVNSRVIWILPNLNPDGTEFDKTSTGFRSWRKNRQPNSGSSAVGTDLNRNWAYNWGCCGGSSTSPSSETYRGAGPESAPEVRVVSDFVRSRVIGGQQRITANIDFHTFGQLILWPYGYTFSDTAPGLDATDRQAFATLGQQMAQTNGYTPEQASDLYITDGTIDDWLWGVQRIFSYTFEMFPTSSSPGFYPGDQFITQETTRNTNAVLLLLDYADCIYRIINVSCGGGNPPTTVFSDNFEAANGWTTNASGTDTATTGLWQRGDPAATSSGGTALQLGTTTSGTNDLVTAAAAGASAGEGDVDGGVTSIRSPAITLPTTGTLSLSTQWYLAHLNNATNADFFRVSVVSGTTTTTVFQQLGAASNRAGAWGTANANLTPFAGQTIRILIEAADAAGGSLVEAGVDDLKITQQT